MTAKEARLVSEKSAEALRVQSIKDAKKRASAKKREQAVKHNEWKKEFARDTRHIIDIISCDGRQEYTHTLHSGSRHNHDLYGEENFLKNFEFAVELKSIIAELEADDYVVTLAGERVDHDDSSAYLNSGGECGSERPYWTYDTVLTVKW